MAKFNYKMQHLLNIKLQLETVAKSEYAEMAYRLAKEEDNMRRLVAREREYQQEARQLVSSRLDVAELRRCGNSIRTMKEFIQQQALQVRIAQKNLDQAKQRLDEAMQERKIQEKLKEKAFEAFKLELNAEEMKEIDQLVSFQYNDKGQKAEA